MPLPKDLDVQYTIASEPDLGSESSQAMQALQEAVESFAAVNGPDLHRFISASERMLIIHALDRARGIKLRAAQALGINRVTLDRKIAEHGLQVARGTGVVGT